jgi:hypothetical protein
VHLIYFFALQSRANCPPHSPPRPPAKDNPAPRNTKTWGSQHLDMGHLLEYIEVLVSSSSHRRGCPSWRRGALLAAAMRGPRCCTVLAPHAARPGGPLHAITAPSTHRRQVLRCGGRCTEHRRRHDARARTPLELGVRFLALSPPKRKESADCVVCGACVWRGPRPLCLHLNKPRSALASCPRGAHRRGARIAGLSAQFSLVCSRAARLRLQQQHAGIKPALPQNASV